MCEKGGDYKRRTGKWWSTVQKTKKASCACFVVTVFFSFLCEDLELREWVL
jgi:hypothetical protein